MAVLYHFSSDSHNASHFASEVILFAGSRSPSPEQARAADALARARHVLRTVESRRLPRGRGGGGHSRSNTFDVADLSSSTSLQPDTPGLARMATMDTSPTTHAARPSAAASYSGYTIESQLAAPAMPAEQQNAGGGQMQWQASFSGGVGGPYTQSGSDFAKRASAGAIGYGENQAGMIPAHRASQGVGRSSDAYLPAPPPM